MDASVGDTCFSTIYSGAGATSAWHDDRMSALVKVLEFAKNGQPVPDDVFVTLTAQEQQSVRSFENTWQIEHGWREITLSILRTATALSRGKDQMKVLEELVESSRSIIRSDVAYIALNRPEEGLTQVLASSGVVTEQFRNVVVPLGVGITGSVAATKQAAWTSDHGQDPEVSHVPHIDAAVKAEGLHAFLGAPLLNTRGMQGALMVGDRRPRHYSPDEIIILDSLASLASVALETAQLIEEMEENLTALRLAHEQSRQQVQQLEILAEADSQLMDVLAQGAKTSEVREVLREKLECEAWFWRDDQPYPARRGEEIDLSPDVLERMKGLIAQSQDTNGIAMDESMSALAISLNERHLGAICVDRAVDDTQTFILHRASQTFATILLFREAVVEAENRQVDDLFRKLVTGSANDDDIARIRRIAGIDLRKCADLELVVLKTQGDLPNARVLNRILGDRGHLFEHQRHLCAVVSGAGDEGDVMQEVYRWAGENQTHFFVGAISLPQKESEIVDAHARAEALASSMASLDMPNQTGTASTFGSLGLLLGAGGHTINQIITDGIGALLSYDEQHHTELTATAARYFDCSRSVALTAKSLYIHENTVRQRIERITEVLGPGWNSGVKSLDTHLALRAWQLKGVGQQDNA